MFGPQEMMLVAATGLFGTVAVDMCLFDRGALRKHYRNVLLLAGLLAAMTIALLSLNFFVPLWK